MRVTAWNYLGSVTFDIIKEDDVTGCPICGETRL
ncbi:MAG: hypothetical protein QG666_646 [Euryarchaeota archaeon]|nr:hypothetical protein [Euryarchaeota archaeon]